MCLSCFANATEDESSSLEKMFGNKFETNSSKKNKKMVKATKKINLKEFPKSYNPSIVKLDKGYLLTFRFMPDYDELWLSNIGVVLLDDEFNQISKPQLVDTRVNITTTPSQSEDARIFACDGKLYLIFNDSLDLINPSFQQHRDMYISELSYVNDTYVASTPLKIFHKDKYQTTLWQKNWVPFVWNNTMLFAYSIVPHEILLANLIDGSCESVYNTPTNNKWNLGTIRGGTPALLVDGAYLGFFHSCTKLTSDASGDKAIWHYFMGAYTFSKDPPFELIKISNKPIIGKNFYNNTDSVKRVIFPGGFVVVDDSIIIAYGKDDREVWIATIDKEILMSSLFPVDSLAP